MTAWTNVKKHGLPDESGAYLVVFSDGDMEVLHFHPEETRATLWEEPLYMPISGKKVFVTHWAELPEGPNGA